MPIYTVQDQTTGKKVTFEWNAPSPPTDKDMEEIFSQAQTATPTEARQPQPIMGMQESGVLRAGESRYQEYLRQAPRVGGGILGGIVGTPAGPAGTMAGISLGAMGGELLEQARRYMVGKGVFGQPSEIEQMRAPQSVSEAAWEVGKAGIEEPAYQVAGGAVVKGAGKVLAPFARKVKPETKEAIDFLKGRIKPVLTPAEATESRGLDILENISEGSLLGGGKLSTFKLNRQKVLNDIADDIIDQFGERVSPDELGETFVNIVEGKLKAARLNTEPLYNQVKAMAGDIPISTKPLKSFAEPLAKLGKDIRNIEAKNAGDDLVQAISKLPDEIDFNAAKELRSRLISRIDEFNIINKKAPVIGKAKQFIKLIDESVDQGLSGKPEALSLWRDANRLYKEGEKQFNNSFIRRLIKKADPDFGGEPEAIGKMVFRPGAINYVKRIKEATDPTTLKQFKSYYLQTLLSKSVDDSGNIIGNKMLQNMYGKSGTGENVLRELFQPNELKYITNFAKASKIAGERSVEGTGKMWIQLTQAGAAGTMLGMGSTPAAGAILITPAMLSRVLLNPRVAGWLTTGYHLPPSSPAFGGYASRMIGAIYRADQEYKAMRDKSETTGKRSMPKE